MKRHEVLVKHYEKAEEVASANWETLDALTEKHFQRGILSKEEFSELVEYRDAFEKEYLGAMTRRFQAEYNTRRSHVSYCKVRQVKTVALTLAQVSARLTQSHSLQGCSTPEQLTAPNILATCHASNAPGLSRIAMTYGRSSPASS